MIQIQPLFDNILLEIEEVKEIGGIILPENRNDIEEIAKVLAVGGDVSKVKKGDMVAFKSWALDEITLNQGTKNEKKIIFIEEKNIKAKVVNKAI